MFTHRSSQSNSFPAPLLEYAVFGLDRWLRRRQGVYEYSSDPACILRIQRYAADETVALRDGTRIAPGDPILNLHLWNEHIPSMSHGGATVRWARRVSRATESSLRDLARYMVDHPDLDDIIALRADVRLWTVDQRAQLARLTAHLGFEPAIGALHPPRAPVRLGENIFMLFLVLASNPAAAGAPVLRREHTLVYLSRTALDRRYGKGDSRAIRPWGTPPC